MNNLDQAVERISSFLWYQDKFLLISGTHQYEKHILALRLVFNLYKSPATILFRSNSMQNLQSRSFLGRLFHSKINFKTGTPYQITRAIIWACYFYFLFCSKFNCSDNFSARSPIASTTFPIRKQRWNERMWLHSCCLSLMFIKVVDGGEPYIEIYNKLPHLPSSLYIISFSHIYSLILRIS